MVATQIIQLTGHITEDGELKVALPPGLAPGEVRVTLEVTPAAPSTDEAELPWEERPWTDEELAELLKIEPKPGAEALEEIKGLPGWTDMGITDSAEWVLEQREKNRRQYPKW